MASADLVVLNLYGREEKPIRAVALDSLGMMSWIVDIFSDYRRLPEPPRYSNN